MHWMILPLRRYAEFRGRSRRIELWMWVLFQFMVYVVLVSAIFAIVGTPRDGGISGGVVALSGVLGVFWRATLLPNIAVGVRRLHDSDRSGWWLMLWAGPYLTSIALTGALTGLAAEGGAPVPGLFVAAAVIRMVGFVGAIVLLIFYCLPGTRGSNRFGADPLGSTGTADLHEVFG